MRQYGFEKLIHFAAAFADDADCSEGPLYLRMLGAFTPAKSTENFKRILRIISRFAAYGVSLSCEKYKKYLLFGWNSVKYI